MGMGPPDVYKRQGLHRYDERLVAVDLAGDDGLLLIAAGHAARNRDRPLAGAHAVSYTHLDVYKRQTVYMLM